MEGGETLETRGRGGGGEALVSLAFLMVPSSVPKTVVRGLSELCPFRFSISQLAPSLEAS